MVKTRKTTKKKTLQKKSVKKKLSKDIITQEDKTIGMLSHLLAIFSGFIGPLILYLVTMDKKGFAYENARHALNFQISLFVYYAIAFALIITIIGIIVTILAVVTLPIFALIVEIVGSVQAYNGKVFKYPLEIPFIK